MQQHLPKLLFSFFTLFVCAQSFGQVTALSNNTSLSSGFVVNGKALLISDNDSLWITTAQANGTKKLSSAVSLVDSIGGVLFNNKFYFAGRTATNGVELWVTDGTTTGTKLIKDIRVGSANSLPDNFIVFNNKIYFTANDGSHGNELWTSDGTATGTVLVKDIYAGTSSGVNTTVLFIANNGLLYFAAKDATNGTELWKTTGTATGTVLVKNITSGSASTEFTQFIKLGTEVVFATKVVSGGFDMQMQLWKTNGTSTGTILLKNFGSLSGFFPPSFFAFKGKIYFVGTSFTTTGSELWVTDGTAIGTKLVKDIYPGTEGSTPFLFNAIIIGTKFYFTATDSRGAELWGSDGTATGTTLVKDINPGSNGSDPIILKKYTSMTASPDTSLYNGKIFFIANNGAKGDELWITNGTATGTVLVKDIWTGIGSGISDTAFTYIYTTSGLYFSGADSLKGNEPWISNGTATGTKIVADIYPGKKGSNPRFLYIYNSQLLLNANNGDNTVRKTDLYKITALTAPLLAPVLAQEETIMKTATASADVNVWPNPAHDQLAVAIGANDFTRLDVVDYSGRTVVRQTLNGQPNQSYSIRIATLPAGVYYLKLTGKNASKTIPFVKQ